MPETARLLHKGEFTELWYGLDASSEPFVRKFSAYPGDDKLENEAAFIRETLPGPAREYFCQVTRAERDVPGRSFSYDMPYYEGRLLRHIAVDGNIGVVESVSHIRASITALKTTLYAHPSTEQPGAFARTYYIDRVAKRVDRYTGRTDRVLDITGANAGELTSMQLDPLFRDIISRPSISLNGRRLLTPLAIVDRIRATPSLMRTMVPRQGSMRLIHGDPHLGNIMIREGTDKPLFFDPNGFHAGGDMAYDIGKLILSLDYLEPSYEKKLVLPTVSSRGGDITVGALKSFIDPDLGLRSREIVRAVIEDVLPEIFAADLVADPGLLDRAVLAADLHALAAAHTFIPTARPEMALPLLLYHLEAANDHLDLLEEADPDASARSVLLPSIVRAP
ncbi:phosphotransferase [Kitasatospora sp. NBC_01250]|uniref:phosphotransferase n=1 Tax=unclassified Kitasatospora TaxID=2633591 RepID=UPI002E14F47F|nr:MULTISPECIES: phosphotransferase [unclassified Kitasatospora]WSJ66708.1 phosphotransferase [Kitasatospora sp. NBC_01302]